MLGFITKRLLLAIPTILGVIFIVMLTIELVPGDPVELMLGEHATREAVEKVRTALGLDKPLITRYVLYVKNLARGDMGRSIRENREVTKEISDVWPATVELTLAAMLIAIVLGVSVGIISAVKPNSWFDNVNRVVSLLGLSMPVFWTGLVLIVIFSFWLRLFPIGGTGTLRHLILPAFTLSLPSIAMISRMTRSSLLEVLKEDYVRTAKAKGLSPRVVILRHALRNALIPIVTLSGLQTGQLMGGAILTETVFGWPGLGRLMVRAIFARDYILLQGAVLVFALAFVVINLLVDLSYSFLDPRVSTQ
jgi:peptide/nickel transport system permease protein/oligopeptide transport system permease protein